VISLVDWHIVLNRVSGSMALRFHKATAEDLHAWAAELQRLAKAMEETAAATPDYAVPNAVSDAIPRETVVEAIVSATVS
jgi:hypothetical protein